MFYFMFKNLCFRVVWRLLDLILFSNLIIRKISLITTIRSFGFNLGSNSWDYSCTNFANIAVVITNLDYSTNFDYNCCLY